MKANNFGELAGSVLCGKNSTVEQSTDITRHPNSEDEEPWLPSGNRVLASCFCSEAVVTKTALARHMCYAFLV